MSLRRRGEHRYVEGEFDFIVGHDTFTDICYVWSWAETKAHKSAISIVPEAAEAWHKVIGV